MTDVRHLTLVGREPPELMPHYYESVPGFFWAREAYDRLLRTLPQDAPSTFVEVGAFQGRSTCYLGVEILRSGKPVTLHVVDSFVGWDGVPQGADLMGFFAKHVRPVREALRHRFLVWPLPSVEKAAEFDDESVDVVFLDGDHAYDAVSADIDAWWPKLKSGGFMAGDDFNMAPVCRAVCERFAPSGYILVHGWNDSGTEQQGCWPSWIARKA